LIVRASTKIVQLSSNDLFKSARLINNLQYMQNKNTDGLHREHLPRNKVIKTIDPEVKNLVRTRIPTEFGNFILYYYQNSIDSKEHIALVRGDVSQVSSVPIRIHSECFTGDVLNSRRCDCRDQLHAAMGSIGESKCGILIYLRQEGRGIGLLEKLKAYNLQDQGLDTVDANIHLGHRADERSYQIAALILKDLDVSSVKVMTNNPTKIHELSQLGIQVDERIPIEVGHHNENADYLKTKVEKMSHMLSLAHQKPYINEMAFLQPLADRLISSKSYESEKPFVTVSYAQSIDGSIAFRSNDSISLSCDTSLQMTHMLRSEHDALLVGINTILTDNPQLNVRFYDGPDPQPIVLDSQLRFPLNAKLLVDGPRPPIILTTEYAAKEKQKALEQAGAKVICVAADSRKRVNLPHSLELLNKLGLRSIMVEGGASIIGQFLSNELTDYCIVTIAPKLIGGLKAVETLQQHENTPSLSIIDCKYHQLGSDIIVYGEIGEN